MKLGQIRPDGSGSFLAEELDGESEWAVTYKTKAATVTLEGIGCTGAA